jgi:hypothetical protein
MTLQSFEKELNECTGVERYWYENDQLHVSWSGEPADHNAVQIAKHHDVTMVERRQNSDKMPILIYKPNGE